MHLQLRYMSLISHSIHIYLKKCLFDRNLQILNMQKQCENCKSMLIGIIHFYWEYILMWEVMTTDFMILRIKVNVLVI